MNTIKRALGMLSAIVGSIATVFGGDSKDSQDMKLSETDEYILDEIRKRVWSGFYTHDEIDEMIDDILEDDANETMLRAAIKPELRKKKEAEKSWPKQTDCDRLNSVFNELEKQGILCLHNAGYTMSDAHSDAYEIYSEAPKGKYFGYCFYHGQDTDRAIDGGGLMLAFDHVKGDVPEKMDVALKIKEMLEKEGFTLDWDGTTEKRINIPNFVWKNRMR